MIWLGIRFCKQKKHLVVKIIPIIFCSKVVAGPSIVQIASPSFWLKLIHIALWSWLTVVLSCFSLSEWRSDDFSRMRLCRRIHRTKLHSRCVLLTKYLSTEGGWSNVFKCCLGLRTRYLWWNGENTILTLYSRAPIIWTWKVQTVNNQDSSHAKKISIKWCLTQLSGSAFFSAFRQAPGGNAEIAIDFCRCRSRQQIKDCNLGKSVVVVGW